MHANANDNNGYDDLYGRRSGNANNDGSEEDEKLYSVKWYKDNEEFYRYVPRANPPQRIYSNVEGVRVDVSTKTHFLCTLESLKRTEGPYSIHNGHMPNTPPVRELNEIVEEKEKKNKKKKQQQRESIVGVPVMCALGSFPSWYFLCHYFHLLLFAAPIESFKIAFVIIVLVAIS